MFSGKEGALLLVWLSFMHAAVKGTNNILFYTSLTYLFEQRTSSNQNKLVKVCNRRKLHLWPFYYLLFGIFLQYCLFLTLLHPKLTVKKVFERIFSLLFYLLLFSLLSTHFHFYNSLTSYLVASQTHFLYRDERLIDSSLYVIVNLSPAHSDVKEQFFCPFWTVIFSSWFCRYVLPKNLMTQIVLCFNTFQRSCCNIYCNLLDQRW